MEERMPPPILTGAADLTEEPAPLQPESSQKQAAAAAAGAAKSGDSSMAAASTTKKTRPNRATSATNSPSISRESSPVRPPLKNNSSSARSTGPGRSRKNSAQDISPSRASSTSTNPPSAAATQRALSAASTPVLHPVPSDPSVRAPAPLKALTSSELKETPRWPISPRLRSPPPINKHSSVQPRKVDQEIPTINAPRSTSDADLQDAKTVTTDSETEDYLTTTGMRTPARGASGSTLETVQEISQPSTPGGILDGILEGARHGRLGEQDEAKDPTSHKTGVPKGAMSANESGSESGGKGEMKSRATSLAPATAPRANGPPLKSYSVGAGRGKPSGDGIAKTMTVETETVSSIPQVAVGGAGAGNGGSVRTKPSSETIRPKKEKKKSARKPPSVNAGVASSKADIFEAKVASAVDEANSSDSEETFVYESNPPDNNDRPRRYHSRTPSVTSMASQADLRNGGRSALESGHSVAMKKSMKFANSYNSNVPEVVSTEDDGKSTIRSSMGTGRGTTHHHHIGRWGRKVGNGHPSLFDNESPFPNAAKSKLAGNGNSPRNSSQSSPRIASRIGLNGKKSALTSQGYDIDDGADDERTPLVSSIRSARSNRNRRPLSASIRQLEHQASRQDPSFLSRFAGCLVLSLMIVLVITGAVGFMFATTQALTEVKVLALKNVLASEQELIVDMKVSARNPNLVAIMVDMAEITVIAKSKYAGTDPEWWKRPSTRSLRARRLISKRDDDPNDPPIDDDPTTNPPFDIGKVYELTSPLTFDGSPFHHTHSISTGQIRITHPGNQTGTAASERWGRLIQHEFELKLQGTLKYTLPLNQRIRKVIVEARVTVKPNAADQDLETVHITT